MSAPASPEGDHETETRALLTQLGTAMIAAGPTGLTLCLDDLVRTIYDLDITPVSPGAADPAAVVDPNEKNDPIGLDDLVDHPVVAAASTVQTLQLVA